MRVAILCNGEDLALWQRDAVERIAAEHQLYILACAEPPAGKRSIKHAAYYALNLFTVRNRLTRRVPFPTSAFAVAGRFDCAPLPDGNWVKLPDAALDWLKDQGIDAVVKFGLGLLRIPDRPHFNIPILSYHHGDPRRFRGRPAGFWELVSYEPLVGQVVQILSNRLDAGTVLAFAESNVAAHSYRRTLLNAYALSPYLLPRALRALADGTILPIGAEGRNYRLPSNVQVMQFVLRRLSALLLRLIYGAVIEKRWKVATVGAAGSVLPTFEQAEQSQWQVTRLTAPFSFFADPFFVPGSDEVIAEAMHRWTGRGELVLLRNGQITPLGPLDGHASYPACLVEDGETYCVPEVSEWRRPAIYRIQQGGLAHVAELDIAAERLIDPTFFRRDGRLYLLANTQADGPAVLQLWTSSSLFSRFELHPASPVRISAIGSRMAGNICERDGELWRFGQDSRNGYGHGILAFRIAELTPESYREEEAGCLHFRDVRGPHTINFHGDRMLFDFFTERASLLAGIRRLSGKL